MLYAIASQSAVYNERLAILLGFATLTMALATFASCRTFVSIIIRLGLKSLVANLGYKVFSKYHMYYWWLFGTFIVAHVMMSVFHTGLPKAGDPDAGIHWLILSFGLTTGIAGLSLFTSCRISPRLFSPKIQGVSLTNDIYRSFFKNHSFYWIVFGLLVASHIGITYAHVGVWPVPTV
jgi:hypothetical protein